ncbi:MAG: hypothetical protein AAGN46_08930 [Acidobacteriota bacterium]
MATLRLNLDDALLRQLIERAERDGESTSGWVGRRLAEILQRLWPPEIEGLAGAWAGEAVPLATAQRAGLPPAASRPTLTPA